MKRKIIIVAAIMWLAALLGGSMWGRMEHRLRMLQTSPGVLELQKLRDLYAARLFDEVLAECDRADADDQCATYAAQILYVRWVTNRRLGRSEESDRVRQRFLARFPDHVLAADMYFARAVDLLAAGDYMAAEKELAAVADSYPSSLAARKAKKVLERLGNAPTTAPAVR